MKLDSMIDLYAGGPGSGCNPEVAQPRCGRPALGKDIHEHVGEYQHVFRVALRQFKAVVGNEGIIEGRVKTASSLAEKLQRRGYGLNKVRDTAGLRVTVKSLSSLYSMVGKLKSSFKVMEEINHIESPSGGVYRAYHLIVKVEGKPVEIQVRTVNQSRFAVWAHDTVYKGVYSTQKAAVQYMQRVSTYVYNKDKGREGVTLPNPPSFLSKLRYSDRLPYIQHRL